MTDWTDDERALATTLGNAIRAGFGISPIKDLHPDMPAAKGTYEIARAIIKAGWSRKPDAAAINWTPAERALANRIDANSEPKLRAQVALWIARRMLCDGCTDGKADQK